mmetsp:Transcript_48308/g.56469  ORF Transcript_48308/g.56469 Transcript_48308/m.56469 type:complete len:519 (-) Transcript_48308:533-2089(-)|eukprot:CAMPEP_0194442398 /NCGR_PEP_ID=MMETSP0176-20130528/126109_1 /TAXON_ID=216777 /ORGANISM="Proboscia alata, Strain PI-D3" /LENGTH=518 /DNA_ID=CAMNT_0039268493 /DNA_START=978 /DNA_END=2534 /DNA_ORIENTATION=-
MSSTDTMFEMADVAGRILMDSCCEQYRWMTYAAGIFGFIMAFGIGANDVANAFATSVSAKSLSLKQAVIIAAICEFLGAMLLGASVTSTIRKNMIDGDMYTDEPDVLMFGMLTALVSASFMMGVANYFALPISTTHTIIGSIVGFSIAAKGFESIMWDTVALIFVSWAAAPLITGIIGALFFWFLRYFVLRSERSYERSVAIYPATIFLAVGLDLFMVLYKAGKNNAQIDEWGLKFMIPVAWGSSAFLAAVFYFLLGPFLEKRIAAKFDDVEKAVEVLEDKTESKLGSSGSETSVEAEKPTEKKGFRGMMHKIGKATINRDIEAEAFEISDKAKEMWESGEDFDPKTEEMFSYLQVLTACLLSFAHGANDVANAIAPLSAVLAIYENSGVESKSPVQRWVLALGGVGIVFGLALYGYKLIISLGYRMTRVTPSRGFAIELSAATVVVVASFIGIPISTTQCKVGGTIAVGMFGGKKSLDPWFLLKIVAGWVLTFFGVCALNAGIFAFAYYAPSAKGYA